MNTEGLITKLRNIVAIGTGLSLSSILTPELPQTGDNMIAITILGGNSLNNLCGVQERNLTCRALIRGTTNDTTTRELTDKVYNSLHLQKNIEFDNNIIIQIIAQAPVFVGKDNDLRDIYNITFLVKEK